MNTRDFYSFAVVTVVYREGRGRREVRWIKVILITEHRIHHYADEWTDKDSGETQGL